jgi:hypothetical protein
MNGKKYIYNSAQANFYIQEGCKCLETGKHHKTNKIFWVFDWSETQQAYAKWLIREH